MNQFYKRMSTQIPARALTLQRLAKGKPVLLFLLLLLGAVQSAMATPQIEIDKYPCRFFYRPDNTYQITYQIDIYNVSTAGEALKNIQVADNLVTTFGLASRIVSAGVDGVWGDSGDPNQSFPWQQDNADAWNGTSTINFLKDGSNGTVANMTLYPGGFIHLELCIIVKADNLPTGIGSGNTWTNKAAFVSARTTTGTNLGAGNVVQTVKTSTITNQTDITPIRNRTIWTMGVKPAVYAPPVSLDGTHTVEYYIKIKQHPQDPAHPNPDGPSGPNTNMNVNFGLWDFINNNIPIQSITSNQIYGNSSFVFNPDYNGYATEIGGVPVSPQDNLLTGTLALNDSALVKVTLVVGPTEVNWDQYQSSWSDAIDAGGDYQVLPSSVQDTINDPYAQCHCYGDPVKLEHQKAISATKSILSSVCAPGQLNKMDVEYEYHIKADPTNNVWLNNLQLLDDLTSGACGSFESIVFTPSLVSTTATSAPALNASYNGTTNTDLFIGGLSDQLDPNQEVVVKLTARYNTLTMCMPDQFTTVIANGDCPAVTTVTNTAQEIAILPLDCSVVACVQPSAISITQTAPTCTGSTANNDGSISLDAITNADKFGVSVGATYSGAPNYASATAIGTLPQSIKTSIPNAGETCTIRFFNGADDCFKDTTVTVNNIFCFVQPSLACGMLIDSFNLDQGSAMYNNLLPLSSTVLGQSILLGGERDLLADNISGTAPIGNSFYVGYDALDLTNGGGEYSFVTVQWDGQDGNANSLNPTGLGGLDFASLNIDKITTEITADFPITPDSLAVSIELWSNAGAASTISKKIKYPNDGNFHAIEFLFSERANLVGSGVDLSDIGAVVLKIDMTNRNGWDVNLKFLRLECCEQPTALILSQTAPTCAAGVAQNDGIITLTSVTNADKFGVSTGATYSGTPAYAAASAVGILPQSIKASIPNAGVTYTFRFFNGSDACYLDTTITVAPVVCAAPCAISVVSATPSVCNPSTDTYTLAVAVTYSNAPTGDIASNGQTFTPNGSGSETFNLTGLPADGNMGINVTASFVNDAACTSTLPSAYDAPVSCAGPKNCNYSPIILTSSCHSNATQSTTTDDYITFLLSPSQDSVMSGRKYSVTATQGGNPVGLTLSDGTAASDIYFGYPTPFKTALGSAGKGDITLTLSASNGCATIQVLTLSDPGTCSVVTAPCAIDSVTYTYRTPFQTTDLNFVPIEIPKFDEAGGMKTLTSVKLDYGVGMATIVVSENRSANPQNSKITVSGDVFIDLRGGATNVFTGSFTPITTGTQAYPAGVLVPLGYNGSIWPGDSIQATVPSTVLRMSSIGLADYLSSIYVDPMQSDIWVTNITNDLTTDDDIRISTGGNTITGNTIYTVSGDLIPFIGTGNVDLTVSTATGIAISGGGGNINTEQKTKAFAEATVTYYFTTACSPCPMPNCGTAGIIKN